MLEIKNGTKRFFPGTINERIALNGINLRLAKGDFVTVIGSNGAGKSTLLNVISGRYSLDFGDVIIAGKNVTTKSEAQRAKWVSRVFQDPLAGSFPHLTIEENLAISFDRGRRRGLGLAVTANKRKIFKEALARLDQGLEKRLEMRVGMLSGGQRQALSLLMAAYVRPDVLLLDEHTASLDPTRAAIIMDLTQEMVNESGLTTLMVTHNMKQAINVGNRLIMMHEGRIILDFDAEQKRNLTVDQLMDEFAKTKGADMSDRALLS